MIWRIIAGGHVNIAKNIRSFRKEGLQDHFLQRNVANFSILFCYSHDKYSGSVLARTRHQAPSQGAASSCRTLVAWYKENNSLTGSLTHKKTMRRNFSRQQILFSCNLLVSTTYRRAKKSETRWTGKRSNLPFTWRVTGLLSFRLLGTTDIKTSAFV